MFEHDAWVGKRCRHRLCVRDFLGKALMEKIAARTPGSSAAFIEGTAIARS
jgi:hypothetical protein